MKYVVFYEPADNVAAKAAEHADAHSARFDAYVRRGELLMIGAFADQQRDGSMAVFSSRAAAEEFVRGDPFVLGGVVRDWTLREWDEQLTRR